MSERGARHRVKTDAQEDRGKQNQPYSTSLTFGLNVLQCFTFEQPVLRVGDIADALRADRRAVRRYVVDLVRHGFLERVSPREYRLSFHVTSLGMSAMSEAPLEEHCQPFIEELCERIRCTISVAVLDGPDVLYMARRQVAEREQSHLIEGLRPGSILPAHCTAMGKALLASLHETDMRKLVHEVGMPHWGPRTITDMTAIFDELKHVRHYGFATNAEELMAGRIAVAVPIRDSSGGVPAAISMATSALLISLKALIERYLGDLVGTAALISERLGFRK